MPTQEGFSVSVEPPKKTWFEKIRKNAVDKIFIYLLVFGLFIMLFVEWARLDKRIEQLEKASNANNFCNIKVDTPEGQKSICEIVVADLFDRNILNKK